MRVAGVRTTRTKALPPPTAWVADTLADIDTTLDVVIATSQCAPVCIASHVQLFGIVHYTRRHLASHTTTTRATRVRTVPAPQPLRAHERQSHSTQHNRQQHTHPGQSVVMVTAIALVLLCDRTHHHTTMAHHHTHLVTLDVNVGLPVTSMLDAFSACAIAHT
jgi:hypothetical protein